MLGRDPPIHGQCGTDWLLIMYHSLLQLLGSLDPETAHRWGLRGLELLTRCGYRQRVVACPVRVMGIEFPNPVGLAAGLDKNGDYIDALSRLGFGFIEVGTVTPKAQLGNPQPRLFRIAAKQAIINRMGFNNRGVDYVVSRLKSSRYEGILGINIGKNRDTPLELAVNDYLLCLQQLYQYADYVTVNVSSPNTPGLRQLQLASALDGLLAALKQSQSQLSRRYRRYVPLVIKISPDLDLAQLDQLAQSLIQYDIDGVIATNTTTDRAGVSGLRHGHEAGGLSGQPLFTRSTKILAQLSDLLRGKCPLIGVGGIMDVDSALAKWERGANLLQIYTGLVYNGPRLIRDIVESLHARGCR